MIYQHRVIFGDTDQMGVVYYGNYMRFIEAARCAYLRERGWGGTSMADAGVGFPVVEVGFRYKRPAHYDDLLDIDIRLVTLGAATIRFEYEVRRDGELLGRGFTRHACVADSGRMCRLPAELLTVISQDPAFDSTD